MGLVAIHHSHADLLKSLGVDACALYKAKQKEVSVIDVLPKQLQCKFCNQEFAEVGNLKAHIGFHQEEGTLRDKKKFECGVCNIHVLYLDFCSGPKSTGTPSDIHMVT